MVLETPSLDPFQIELDHFTCFWLPQAKGCHGSQATGTGSLDELKAIRGSVVKLQSSFMARIDEVEVAIGKRFGALQSTAQVFDDWKPKIDGAMSRIGLSANK